jgi:hypothetical protein
LKAITETLRLETELQACFSGETVALAIEIEDDHAVLSVVHKHGAQLRGERGELKPIALEQARKVIDAVQNLLSRPQKLIGDRSTTLHRARVFWRKGSSTTEWSVSSSELAPEILLEALPRFPIEKQVEIQSAYEGYFNWAHELFRLAKRTAEEHGREVAL